MKSAAASRQRHPTRLAVAYETRRIDKVMAGPPVIAWRGEIQPVPLHRARVTFRGSGRVSSYLPDADKNYRTELQQLWVEDRLQKREPVEEPLLVVMTFAGRSRYRPPGYRRSIRRRQPDLTNLLKAVEDAGNGFLWKDDSQIELLVGEIVAWGDEVVRPEVMVLAWRLR